MKAVKSKFLLVINHVAFFSVVTVFSVTFSLLGDDLLELIIPVESSSLTQITQYSLCNSNILEVLGDSEAGLNIQCYKRDNKLLFCRKDNLKKQEVVASYQYVTDESGNIKFSVGDQMVQIPSSCVGGLRGGLWGTSAGDGRLCEEGKDLVKCFCPNGFFCLSVDNSERCANCCFYGAWVGGVVLFALSLTNVI